MAAKSNSRVVLETQLAPPQSAPSMQIYTNGLAPDAYAAIQKHSAICTQYIDVI